MTNYISEYPGDFKISGLYNEGCIILSQVNINLWEVPVLKIKFEICCKNKELITKELRNITRSPEFIPLEKEILAYNIAVQIEPLTLHYILDNSFNINIRGTYVYKNY
jgi:hypothetical protein